MLNTTSLLSKCLCELGRLQPRLVTIISVLIFLGFMLYEYGIAAQISLRVFRGFTLINCLALWVIIWIYRHELTSPPAEGDSNSSDISSKKDHQ